MSSIKGRYARIEIPLNIAENGKELHVVGDYLSIISITGEGTCEMKLDHRHSQSINFREISGFTGAFDRLYLTTDGGGGTCSIFVGTGMAIQVLPDPSKMWSGGSISTHFTTTNAVQCLANESLRLSDVTILNEGIGGFPIYVGPYNSNLATFRAYAYTLLAKQTLEFRKKDMYTLGAASYDATNHENIHIIGSYE
jgi:hypothetical protein